MMKCKDCKYVVKMCDYNMCEITHLLLNHPMGRKVNGCTLNSDEDVESMNICFNCKYWIGGGDFWFELQEELL